MKARFSVRPTAVLQKEPWIWTMLFLSNPSFHSVGKEKYKHKLIFVVDVDLNAADYKIFFIWGCQKTWTWTQCHITICKYIYICKNLFFKLCLIFILLHNYLLLCINLPCCGLHVSDLRKVLQKAISDQVNFNLISLTNQESSSLFSWHLLLSPFALYRKYNQSPLHEENHKLNIT